MHFFDIKAHKFNEGNNGKRPSSSWMFTAADDACQVCKFRLHWRDTYFIKQKAEEAEHSETAGCSASFYRKKELAHFLLNNNKTRQTRKTMPEFVDLPPE